MWETSFRRVFGESLTFQKVFERVGFDLEIINWAYKLARSGQLNPDQVFETLHFLRWYEENRHEEFILGHDHKTLKAHIRTTVATLLENLPKVSVSHIHK
jgi:hypothetical protein